MRWWAWFVLGWLTAKYIDPAVNRAGGAVAAAYRRRHNDGLMRPEQRPDA